MINYTGLVNALVVESPDMTVESARQVVNEYKEQGKLEELALSLEVNLYLSFEEQCKEAKALAKDLLKTLDDNEKYLDELVSNTLAKYPLL